MPSYTGCSRKARGTQKTSNCSKPSSRGLLQYIKRKGNEKYTNYQADPNQGANFNDREEDAEYDELVRQVLIGSLIAL